MEIVSKAVRGALEFTLKDEKKKGRVRGEIAEVRWCAPTGDVYKLNTDASMIKGKGIGMGGVVRDSDGEVMMATCCGLEGITNVEVAEALSARHGLQIAVETGLRRLIMEVDSKKLFNYLQGRVYEMSLFGKIVADILEYANHCSFINFAHVKRQGNKVAHLLAQMCKSAMELRV